jgi:hypothetical protein
VPFGRNERSRRLAAALALTVVFAFELGSFRGKELRGRLGALASFSRVDAREARLQGSALAFDRRLGLFLEGIEDRTPPSATIALPFASAEGNVSTYVSAYLLAPRRLVDPSRSAEADFAAGPPGSASRGDGLPVPFGELSRRR